MQTVVERPAQAEKPTPLPALKPVARNVAVDAYRGFVMFLMMAEVLRLARVAQAYPGNWFWSILAYNQTHVDWAGCSLHDLIQPSFSFLVGVALPYSIASRMAKGATFRQAVRCMRSGDRCCWSRSASSCGRCTARITYFTFEDTLSQIGLGYPFLFLLGFRPPRWQWIALGVILDGLLAGMGALSGAGPGFDCQAVGVPADWQHHLLRLRRALEQEQQSGQRVRSVVPEPVPANQALRLQWRRLSDAQLHSRRSAP